MKSAGYLNKVSFILFGENIPKYDLGAMELTKRITLVLLLLSVLLHGRNDGQVHGNTNDTPQSFEEIFTEIGYTTIDNALDDFEQHYKQKLKLPLRVPPISFTHYVGKFSNIDGDKNDAFEVKFISDQFPENHFKINVRPIRNKIEFSDKYDSKTFKLNNGRVAAYIEKSLEGFNLLVFERDDWQYMFSIDKKVSDKVTPEILVQIANSIDF